MQSETKTEKYTDVLHPQPAGKGGTPVASKNRAGTGMLFWEPKCQG